MTGSAISLPPRLLELLMLKRMEDLARQEYALQLMWLTGLQLFSMAGGRDYPIPSPGEVFPGRRSDSTSAEDIRQRILRLLQEERSES